MRQEHDHEDPACLQSFRRRFKTIPFQMPTAGVHASSERCHTAGYSCAGTDWKALWGTIPGHDGRQGRRYVANYVRMLRCNLVHIFPCLVSCFQLYHEYVMVPVYQTPIPTAELQTATNQICRGNRTSIHGLPRTYIQSTRDGRPPQFLSKILLERNDLRRGRLSKTCGGWYTIYYDEYGLTTG